MRHGFARTLALGSMSLCLALVMGLSLAACGDKETAKKEQAAPAPVDTTAVDPNAKTALENVQAGTPSATAPKNNDQGAVHKGETLYFVIAGEYGSEAEAQKGLEELNKAIEATGQQEYFTVIASDNISGFDPGKFLVAEAYPSQEAIDGYNVLGFIQKIAPKGVEPYVKAGTFNSDQKIVVFGVDVQ